MKNYRNSKDVIYSKVLGLDEKFIKTFYSLKCNNPLIENEFSKLIEKKNLY